MRSRLKALRRAWRTFWWMAVWHKPGQTLSRWMELRIALHEARCGLMTGGEHSWGPLHYPYEGARQRNHDCRWCGASLTPTLEVVPPTDEEWEQVKQLMPARVPTDKEVEAALKRAEKAGIYRKGKFLWE
jgi:hypothetical protein